MAEAIQVPGHAHGNCKSCHAGILWAQTERGKWIPLDVEETIGAGLVLFTIDAKGIAHRAAEGVAGRESHFATCPDGPIHRRRA